MGDRAPTHKDIQGGKRRGRGLPRETEPRKKKNEILCAAAVQGQDKGESGAAVACHGRQGALFDALRRALPAALFAALPDALRRALRRCIAPRIVQRIAPRTVRSITPPCNVRCIAPRIVPFSNAPRIVRYIAAIWMHFYNAPLVFRLVTLFACSTFTGLAKGEADFFGKKQGQNMRFSEHKRRNAPDKVEKSKKKSNNNNTLKKNIYILSLFLPACHAARVASWHVFFPRSENPVLGGRRIA